MKELEDHYYTLGVIAVSSNTLVLPYTDMIIHVLIIFLNVFCGKISGTNIFSSCVTCALRTWRKALAVYVCVFAVGITYIRFCLNLYEKIMLECDSKLPRFLFLPVVTARGSIMNHRSLINEPLKTKGV
jgi:uncharacterized membrane protein (DUF485 family)